MLTTHCEGQGVPGTAPLPVAVQRSGFDSSTPDPRGDIVQGSEQTDRSGHAKAKDKI